MWPRIFARISLNFHEKFFVQLLPTNSLPRRSWRPCLVWPPKKVFVWFSANLGRHFLKSSKVGRHFHADYQGCCPDFQQIKTFGGALAHLPPTSTTVFHNSIIVNFVVYQDRPETYSLELFEHPENSEWLWWTETNIIGNDFFVSFHCPKMFYCSPALPVLQRCEICMLCQLTSPKRWLQTWIWRNKQRITRNNDHQ